MNLQMKHIRNNGFPCRLVLKQRQKVTLLDLVTLPSPGWDACYQSSFYQSIRFPYHIVDTHLYSLVRRDRLAFGHNPPPGKGGGVACSRLSVSEDDRKIERAKNGISCERDPGVKRRGRESL